VATVFGQAFEEDQWHASLPVLHENEKLGTDIKEALDYWLHLG